MTGWGVDVVGLSGLLGRFDEEVGEVRSAVTDATDALDGCAAALAGPVANAFAAFAAPRRAAPGEVVTRCDAAVDGVVGAAAAISAGDLEMAEQLRLARLPAQPVAAWPAGVPQPW